MVACESRIISAACPPDASGLNSPTVSCARATTRIWSMVRISGLSPRRFAQMEGWFDDLGPVTNAGAASQVTAAAEGPGEEAIVNGGNIVASLGYGYVAAAATGTVTDVCDDEVAAFGHPFTYGGRSTLGYLESGDVHGRTPQEMSNRRSIERMYDFYRTGRRLPSTFECVFDLRSRVALVVLRNHCTRDH